MGLQSKILCWRYWRDTREARLCRLNCAENRYYLFHRKLLQYSMRPKYIQIIDHIITLFGNFDFISNPPFPLKYLVHQCSLNMPKYFESIHMNSRVKHKKTKLWENWKKQRLSFRAKRKKRSVSGAITEFQLHLKGSSINLGSNFPTMTSSG